MNAYQTLTRRGKLHRLRGLALMALAQYDLPVSELAFHAFETNLFFRVSTPAGERFALRMASPGWRTFEDLQSEALWLEALGRETDIPAPRILLARSGEKVLPVSGEGVPKTWNTLLMSWVPGQLLGHHLTPRNLEKMGALFAALHQHGAAWKPPAGFTTRRFEHWLSRDEPNLITPDGRSASDTPQAKQVAALPAAWRALLERIHVQVEQAYASLDRADLRVIHCDLWHDNIKLHHGVLHPFDFEDTVWGFRAHDMAMAMLDLLETVGESRYPELLRAFRYGYSAYTDWPDDPLEPFQIGRLLWKINWVARFDPEHLRPMVERHAPVFEHYQRTGEVILPVG